MDANFAESPLAERLADALDPREETLDACLFGSYARGQAQRHSDVDAAVYVDETKEFARPVERHLERSPAS